MDRPVTSKPRGICKYYNSSRGCYAGDTCKFLHGAEETLSPYDKSKVCKFYVRGHCNRGERCWFRHELQEVHLDDELKNFDENMCTICLEKPKSYGLLSGCSHVFCLQCIRQWREPQGKSPDMVVSGIIKRCPICRLPSRFISPSTHFFPQGHPRKQIVVDCYKNSMARVPCKYFAETSASGKPCCPFGADCFYKHANSDGTPHVFRYGAEHFMKVFRRRQLHHRNEFFGEISDTELADQLRILQSIIEDPTNSLRVALNFVRRHLPAIWDSMDEASATGAETPEDEGARGVSEDYRTPELIAESVAAERLSEGTSPQFPSIADTSNAGEGSSHSPVESSISAPVVSLPPRARSASPGAGLPVTPRMYLRPSSSVEVTTPLPHSFMPWVLPRTPSPRPSSASPTPMTPSIQQSNPSRFSTVLGSRSQETVIIDISDEEDEEDETEGSASPGPPSSASDDVNDNDPLPDSVPLPAPSGPAEIPASSTDDQIAPCGRPQCEHDKDPPFVTDGRGRVVWSRTARGSQGRRLSKVRGPIPETGVSQATTVVSMGQVASGVVGRTGDTEVEAEAEIEAER